MHRSRVPLREDLSVHGLCFSAWVLACALLAVVVACSEVPPPNELDFRVGFACADDRVASSRLRLRVLATGCDEGSDVLYEATLRHGDEAPLVNGMGPGRYGVEATAYGEEEEQVVAQDCLELMLPRAEAIELSLRSPSCASDALDAEVAMDAGSEPPERDADVTSCAGDCADQDPCTEDRCVDGACTHAPFSGARECDGIACTQGDMCMEGECNPGAPNDAACTDDGNPCSAERCVPSAGCNRTNAAADGKSCNDNVACTSPDTCRGGICSGPDTCAAGQVCSAAARMCVSCSGPQDCDDRNPCTTDSCASGACAHTNNTASCDDGDGCTGNDVCAAGRCAGTSTCPSDATCAGSTCSCKDASESLCTNRCVSLLNTSSDCGLCGRACAGGQSCENGACKPATATTCTAYRNGGHDYQFCSELLNWVAARDRCGSYGLVLVIVDNQGENDFLRDRLANAPHWIGANDRGTPGNSCRLSGEEGTWYWATSGNDNGIKLCTVAASGVVSCQLEAGRFQNWNYGEPNNACNSCTSNCGDGQDCATIDPPGTWDDDFCSATFGYICETP